MKALEVLNEPGYAFQSPANPRRYPFELNLAGRFRPSSVHGILAEGAPLAVFGASGGATGVHARSLLSRAANHYLAVGPFVISFSCTPFRYNWALEVDPATCFGVHLHEASGALISHGELQLSRFTEAGQIVWTAGGADIFTGDIEILSEHVRITDFNGRAYCFDYESGRECV
jgi:hypothetical protein